MSNAVIRRARATILLGSSAAFAVIAAAPAHAAGTAAGTVIDNTASASYTPPGGGPEVTVPSNKVSITVDELLDVTVASADPGDIVTTPAATNQVTTFALTNTGNGSEAFALAAVSAIGGDDFDPAVTSIVLDTNNNGVYDAGQDTVYTAGSNDPVLAPDASATVFVLSTTPAGASDSQRAELRLTAVAKTGSGAPGTSFAGQGQGGGDAVVGATGADSDDNAFFVVRSASVALVKSATLLDPLGGTEPVPGAVITYSLVATVSGSSGLSGLRIGDPIPANTTYQPGTLTLEGAPLSDATDADAGEIASGAVAVRLGTVAGGQNRTVTFKVKIN